MSKTKSNVHPGHYKVAGRGRQGEDTIYDRQKAVLAESQAIHEHQAPYAEHVSAFEKKQSPKEETLERARRAEAEGWSRQVSRGRPKPLGAPSPGRSRATMKAVKRRRRTATQRSSVRKLARTRTQRG